MTKQSINPFLRGTVRCDVKRRLEIETVDLQIIERALHESNASRSDESLRRCFVTYNGIHGIVRDENQDCEVEVNAEFEQALRSAEYEHGYLWKVFYEIHAELANGQTLRFSVETQEAASRAVEMLTFNTGIYSRSWEISSAHLSASSCNFLNALVDTGGARPGLYFGAFRLPSDVLGVKLYATPWDSTGDGLAADGEKTTDLRVGMGDKGVPPDLVNVLMLAGEADVRFLLFDADAGELAGLPVFDDDAHVMVEEGPALA